MNSVFFGHFLKNCKITTSKLCKRSKTKERVVEAKHRTRTVQGPNWSTSEGKKSLVASCSFRKERKVVVPSAFSLSGSRLVIKAVEGGAVSCLTAVSPESSQAGEQ